MSVCVRAATVLRIFVLRSAMPSEMLRFEKAKAYYLSKKKVTSRHRSQIIYCSIGFRGAVAVPPSWVLTA